VFDLPGANIRDVVELVGRWKVTPEQLLDGLPITAAALAEPTTRVPLRVAEAIISRARTLTNEPALAFHAGTQMRVSSHGFLGFAAMTAGTAGAALELATRFASTRTSALGLSLYVEGDIASIVIEERTPLGDELREFVVFALAVGIWQLGRTLTGKLLDGTCECAFPEPAYVKSFPLGGRLRFDQPDHRLVFASSILATPLTGADPVATRLAADQCERELAAMDAGFTAKIRAAITGGAASVEAVAKQLHVSPRTLKRKLADHGTTFSAIRDDVRRQRALLLLDNRALSIGEVATAIGYTELPNFTRAFRKWTGLTPVAYRERNRDRL
jgi:AraC-like DNA-binding protein